MLSDIKLDALDAWLAEREADAGGVRPGCHKRIVWADGVRQTDLSVVYVHGFSATAQELRPLPDLVATGLGANLFFTRLTGHGQDGVALGRARLDDWHEDIAETFSVAAALGRDIIVMGCSTGCTLLTEALAWGARAGAAVFVSPNYGLRNKTAQVLIDLPGVRRWGPLIAGRTRKFDAMSDAHAAHWTLEYDTQAIFTMGDAVRSALRSPLEHIQTPVFMAFNPQDQVVDAARTRRVVTRWGGPVHEDVLVAGPEDDPMGHLMAGDIFSPSQTAPLARRILDWLERTL